MPCHVLIVTIQVNTSCSEGQSSKAHPRLSLPFVMGTVKLTPMTELFVWLTLSSGPAGRVCLQSH